ncbi:MAG: tetratricopeptide repeat protein [Gemmatimonadota bacterium]|nr:tetratricopeptide repeat protein [Gemmatimonadota bacterium]
MESIHDEIRTLESLFWSERDPEGRVFVALADAHRRAGDLDAARRLLDEGLTRYPDYPSAHVVAARIWKDRGDLDAAQQSAQRVLSLDDGNTEAVRVLAQALDAMGSTDAARLYWSRLEDMDPGASSDDVTGPEADAALDLAALAPAEPEADADAALDLAALAPAEPEPDADAVLDLAALAPVEPEPEEDAVLDLAALAPAEPEPEEDAVLDLAALAPVEPEPDADAVLDLAALAPVEPEPEADAVLDLAALAPAEPEPVDEFMEVEALVPDEAVVELDSLSPAGFEAGTRGVDPGHPEEVFSLADLGPTEAEGPGGDFLVLADEDDEADLPHTRTMAELFVSQGLVGQGIEVYRRLVDESPDDAGLRARLRELEGSPGPGGTVGDDGTGHGEAEFLARELASSGDDVHDVASPFVWTDQDHGEQDDAVLDGSPAVEYFDRILSWGDIDAAAAAAEFLNDVEIGPGVPMPEPEENEGADDFTAWMNEGDQ